MDAPDSILRHAITLAAAALPVLFASTPSRADDARVRAQLETLAGRSAFFGHQSVGSNILDGLRSLSAREGVALRVEEVTSATEVAPGTLAHGFMAENSDPARKLQSFRAALKSASGRGVEIAFLKFCYIDFTPDTDVQSLFRQYQATQQQLRASHPETTFVHVTVPLTGVQGGLKGFVKRLLGRAPYGLAENARREEYNTLLRQAYAGKEPIFDLARVESTHPDGRVETAEWNGRAVPMMVSAYTSDGGHLNAEGQVVAARALLEVLASVPVSPAATAR